MILRNRTRGQTTAESLIALALFAIAAFGAWALYKDQIRYTFKTMIEKFTGSDSGTGASSESSEAPSLTSRLPGAYDPSRVGRPS